MSSTAAGWLQFALLVAALAACYVPLGNYIAHIFTDKKHWRIERGIYKLTGIDPDADMRWTVYVRSILAFSLVAVLFVYLIERTQHWLFWSIGMANVPTDTAWNTAVSFTTNTNWQNYAGEATMSYLTQQSGAHGAAVPVGRGRPGGRDRDDPRLHPVPDRPARQLLGRRDPRDYPAADPAGGHRLPGPGGQRARSRTWPTTTRSPRWPAATRRSSAARWRRRKSIKDLGNNGGGWFNTNAAHPFESPNPFTNIFIVFMLLLIPFATPRAFGKMVGDNRQGYALVAVMVIIWAAAVGGVSFFETHLGTAGVAAHTAHGTMEGVEVRTGTPGCSVFAASTTVTSTGSVSCFHDSLTPFGGGIALLDIALGEIAPGGIGAGMYGILVLAMVTVFVAGLMVGRTPEYIGKKIRPTEMKYASLYFLTLPVVILTMSAIAIGTKWGQSPIFNPGPHGLSEVVYAYASQANNNGSAFAGLGTAAPFYQITGGITMLLGRFAPEIFALGLAGSLARQAPTPASAGTLDTRTPLFVGMLVGVILILVGLTYFPALALGLFAEGLH